MKKLILKLTYFAALFTFLTACDDVERVYYNDSAETVLSLSDDNLSLSEDSGANEILTLTWSDPDYGFDAAALYSIQIDVQAVSYTHLTLPTKA